MHRLIDIPFSKVKLTEALSICERELSLKYLRNKSPFLLSFQKRLALLCCLRDCVKNERKEILKLKTRRTYANTSLQSTQHPQLKIIISLYQGTLSLLKALPSCLPALVAINQEDLLTQPVLQMCQSLTSIQKLELFSCWSPKLKAPLSKISLKSMKITSSNESEESGLLWPWQCTGGGTWSASFDSSQNISSIQISWVADESKQHDPAAECSAPFRLTILATEYEQVHQWIIKPDDEFKVQKSWTQIYTLDKRNLTKLTLMFSNKVSANNKTKLVKMHKYDIFVESSVVWVDTLQLLQDLQFSLFPLTEFNALKKAALDSVIAIAKASGSLSLFLNILTFLAKVSVDEGLKSQSCEQIFELIESIRGEDNKIRKTLNDTFGCAMKEVKVAKFDPKFGASDKCVVSPAGDSVSCTSGSGFCFISCTMESGVYEWTLSIGEAAEDDEGSLFFGVISSPTVNSKDYAPMNSKGIRAINCKDGSLYTTSPKSVQSISGIKVGDVCRFTFEVKLRMISLSVNGVDHGVLFEQVVKGMSPIVVFKGFKKPVQVNFGGMLHCELVTKRSNSHEQRLLRENLDINVLRESSSSIFSLLLREMESLAQTKSDELKLAENGFRSKPCSLEFPFCVEVSSYVLQQLVILMNLEWTTNKDSKNLKALVVILDLQLYCLSLSKFEMTEVGLGPTDVINSVPCQKLVLELREALKAYMKSSDSELELLAVRAFCQGLCLYSCGVYDKIELVLEVFSAENRYTNTAAARNLLIDLTIRRFCDLDEVLNIIDLCSKKFEHRDRINLFLEKMVEIVADCTLRELNAVDIESANTILYTKNLKATICKFLSAFQQHAVYDVAIYVEESSSESEYSAEGSPLTESLFCLGKSILIHGSKILVSILKLDTSSNSIDYDRVIRGSIIGILVQPFIFSLCIRGHSLKFLHSIMPCVVLFMEKLSEVCNKSPICAISQKSISSTIQRYYPRVTSTTGVGGWRSVRAMFEETDTSYSLSDGGLTYTSLHSTNTCALLNIKFGVHQKAAWEFTLEHDSMSDECSVFGAARLPISSRCYSSSPDLWMRRSYNGYMYNQGQTTGTTLDKIHPGDLVRIEFDGKAGTLSYSVNGGELEVGFTDIAEDIYPACGSYRNGVVIKLVKVEVYENFAVGHDNPLECFKLVPNQSISWILDASIMSTKDNTILTAFIPQKNDKKSKKEPKPSWLTARANSGACNGIHAWSFEFLEWFDAPFALGAVFGIEPPSTVRLAAPSKKSNTAFKQRREAAPGTMVSELCEEATNERTSQSGITDDVLPSTFAWYSDGSLWCDGKKVANSYGVEHLPLPKYSSVCLVANRHDRTISFVVNGENLGPAFGPIGAGAAATILNFPVPSFCEISDAKDRRILYPAASIYSASVTPIFSSAPSVRIRTAGFHGSTFSPLILSLQKSCASVLGRLSALLLIGPDVSKSESVLIPWLQSPLLIGGLEEVELKTIQSESSKSWKSSIEQILHYFGMGENQPNDLVDNLPTAIASGETSSEQNLLKKLSLLEYADADCQLLFDWLESTAPEAPNLKKAYEKAGTFSFPCCEYPVTACLLKHGGLLSEATAAVQSLKLKEKSSPVPSEEMHLLWQKVKQLRTYLRQQRQNFKVSEYSTPSEEVVSTKSVDEIELSTLPPVDAPIISIASDDQSALSIRTNIALLDDILESNCRGYTDNFQIRWIDQPDGIRSIVNSLHSCTVLALGIDEENQQVFVRFSLRMALGVGAGVGALPSPLSSKLKMDGTVFTDPDQFLSVDSETEKAGYLRFEIATLQDRNIFFSGTNVEFEYGIVGFSSVKCVLNHDMENLEAKDPPTRKFDDLCDLISGKAHFLLKMSPAVYAAEFNKRTSKTSLLGLTKKYSGNIPSSGNKADLSRWSSQERWKRVVEFLHIRSKQPQSNETVAPVDAPMSSLESLTESRKDIHERDNGQGQQNPNSAAEKKNVRNLISFNRSAFQNDDDLSHGQAAMQACTVFMTTEVVKFDEKLLNSILLRRLDRANLRMYALNAINYICSVPSISEDPFCVFEILLFIRVSIALYTTKSEPAKDAPKNRNHYLTNLEGCCTLTMSTVQSSFVTLYTTISMIFSNYLKLWERNSIMATFRSNDFAKEKLTDSAPQYTHILLIPMHLIIELWTLNFSNRDHKWVMASGFLSTLFKLFSFSSQEKAIQTWMTAASQLYDFYSKYSHQFQGKYKWNIWSQEYVRSGLLNGSITCRTLLLHICMAPEHRLSKHERSALEIDGKFSQLLESVKSASQASLLYCKVFAKVSQKLELEEKERKIAEAAKEALEAKAQKELALRMSLCGSFDPAYKQELIRLTELNSVATLVGDESGTAVCVYATISYSAPKLATTGNYFEIEIILLGNGDIGVGFADRNTFPLSD